ncbi:MAG TPA: CDP-diacylglycerol--glycerol-3-phosphate 3-phosphatidyltransferase, partial [Actinomycetaceae bacterium]|nr:CDP-diacylglycerol--glycerol-3-phosphate 3-phosphatidyltransferase [Actinomycetaceae bacterium]
MTSPDGVQQTARASAPVWNWANLVTMIRVALVPVFAWLAMQDSWQLRLIGAGVFLLAALTDKLDGYLARSRNLVTNFGKIADPIADKALVLTALVLLAVANTLPWWVPAIIIVRELGITLLRFVMLRRSVMAASAGGKLKTVLQ